MDNSQHDSRSEQMMTFLDIASNRWNTLSTRLGDFAAEALSKASLSPSAQSAASVGSVGSHTAVLIEQLNSLEAQFTEALARHGDGRNLLICIFPLESPVEFAGPLVFERVQVPSDCLQGTNWIEPIGHGTITDHDYQQHTVVVALAGMGRSLSAGAGDFLALARRAGAASYRLPPGMAVTGGLANTPELNWMFTLYAYLKGTDFVIEWPGFSRLHNLFAASVRVLSLICRGDAEGRAPAFGGSLRPGIPRERGEVRIEGVRLMTLAEIEKASSDKSPPAVASTHIDPMQAVPEKLHEPDGAPDAAFSPYTVLLSASDWASKVKRCVPQVETFLRRLRKTDHTCFVEVANVARNQPRYLYHGSRVWDPLREWAGLTDG